MTPVDALKAWHRFAEHFTFVFQGERRSWKEHLRGPGANDEQTLVSPHAFPRFAQELLGFEVGENLAPEQVGVEGKPDFTPADAVTHDFVFEVKGTRDGVALHGHDEQIERYLVQGRPRIRRVVLTNLVGIRVFELDDAESVIETLTIDLRGLLRVPTDRASETGDARRLATFLDSFSFQDLSPAEKLERIRLAEPWNPILEVTNPEWLSARLDRAVELLRSDVHRQILNGALVDPTMSAPVKRALLTELRELEWRVGGEWEDSNSRPLREYLEADPDTPGGVALRQYEAHVAYYAITRLIFVRVWEDLGLSDLVLHDGGFDHWMEVFEDAVGRVVEHAFVEARGSYPSLFESQNAYTWFTASETTHVEVVYQLANTYLGAIESDVLGTVYERLLERVDRKLVGQYYTPRDIIHLIWDLIDPDELMDQAESELRELRAIDIATGSAGFLVDIARRIRDRTLQQRSAGADIAIATAIANLARGLVGIEIQRFPAFLGELNLLIQLSPLLQQSAGVRIPAFGVLCDDTLAYHNPMQLGDEAEEPQSDLIVDDPFRSELAQALKDPTVGERWMDVAIGNPPYIGEKRAASVLRRTRDRHPYWEQFVGPHLDYLYWFLITGVSKLRQGGRFGFITTEYWLRADGGRPLREYLARRTHIHRIILFRDMRLFPDAPGQHSMVIVGERVVAPDPQLHLEDDWHPDPEFPLVSIYTGPNLSVRDRAPVLERLRTAERGGSLRTFTAAASPNELGGTPWSTVLLTREQLARRRRMLATAEPLDMTLSEGVISGADRMRANYAEHLTAGVFDSIGWPDTRTGIFVLTPTEADTLGLSPSEQEILEPTVNTRDVLPYASIVRSDADQMIYLPAPHLSADSDLDAAQQTPFPVNIPRIQSHLDQFRSLLQHKVQSYGERRPWWSIHRPRPEIMERRTGDHGWADYALTTRWGGGEKLIVGMAPNRSVPMSGLHALLPPHGAGAAYVVGLLNSTVVQEMAETLPPGEIRQSDLLDLGLPLIEEAHDEVEATALELANIVSDFMTNKGASWPSLEEALRDDIALGNLPSSAWLPQQGPPSTWGEIANLQWVGAIETGGTVSATIQSVETLLDLFGPAVLIQGGRSGWVRLRLNEDNDPLLEALEAYLNGLQATGTALRDIPSARAPIDFRELIDLRETARDELKDFGESYQTRRAAIDSIVDELI